MAKTINLHKFEQDLVKKPGLGDMGPPRTIRAKDLDENNKKLTLLNGEGANPIYEVKYTDLGILITRILPTPPDSSVMHVLTVTNKVLAWVATEDCDE